MNNFEDIGRELARRGKTEELRRLADSAEGQRLSQTAEAAAIARAAKAGDSAALQQLIKQILSTPEGRKLADDVQRMMRSF